MPKDTVTTIRESVEGKTKVICLAIFTSKDWYPYYEAFADFFDDIDSLNFGMVILRPSTSRISKENENRIRHTVHTLEPGRLVELDFVDVFLTLDWNPYSYDFPTTSKVVAFTHYFSTARFRDQIHNCCGMYGGDMVDYHFISPPMSEGERRGLRRTAAHKAFEFFPADMLKKRCCIIPGGYPKLDKYIQHCRGPESGPLLDPPKSLLFAVTGIVNSDKTLPVYGSRILQTLLSDFPDHQVIFRPTPMDRNHELVTALIDEFSSHERFKADLGDDLKESYASSAIMICDQTNARSTFAYATLRPYLRCCLEPGQRHTPETSLGANLYEIDFLSEAVRTLLDNLEPYSRRIRQECDNSFANQGRSLKHLAENIEFITNDKEHAEWLYYDKGKIDAKAPTEAKQYLPYIEFFASRGINCIQRSKRVCEHALTLFPDDPALLATLAKILFIQKKDALAAEFRNRAYSLDKGTAGKHLWGRSSPGQSSGGVRFHLRMILQHINNRVLHKFRKLFLGPSS